MRENALKIGQIFRKTRATLGIPIKTRSIKTELKGMVLNYGIDVYHQWKDFQWIYR